MNLADLDKSVTPYRMRESGQPENLADTSLRIGKVIKVHYPSDPTSISKRFNEYDVQCIVGGGATDSERIFVIPRCRVASAFGGVADFTRWTPRVTAKDPKERDFGESSVVLVQLINGSPFGGIIIGGPQSMGGEGDQHTEKDDATDGHWAVTQFNGIRMEINNDGELVISRTGATDGFGRKLNLADPEGSKIQLLNGGDVSVDAMKDFRVVAQQSIYAESQMETTLKAGVAVITDSPLVQLGGSRAIDSMIKGTTYRAAESSSNATLVAALTSLASAMGGLAAAAPPLQTASTPPMPLAPLFVTAAAALSAAAAAISAFEAGSTAYLSTHNFLD